MSAELLELAASALGSLVDDVVFVGGATIHLWLTEPGGPPTRSTDDVDVICNVASIVDYYKLAEQLREHGFAEVMEEPVVCRWQHRETGLMLDLMPTEETVLGFSNPWYELAMEGAVKCELPSGARIRVVLPPVIFATKLAAWKGRGRGDVLKSLDVHDIVVLIDGRPQLTDELAAQSPKLREYVALELASLRNDPYFDYVIQSTVRGYGQLAADRATIVEGRVAEILEVLGRGGGK